jgi:RNA polymerase sigma factor (sigma-70 family)
MPDPYQLARDGDPAATRAIVTALRPRLTRMAAYYARRTGDDADDLLQEAWFGLLEALPLMDPRIGSPRQYLLSRARWRMLDAVRRERLRRCLPLGPDEERMDSGTGWDEAVGKAAVGQFMGALEAKQRTVLTHLLGGLTWREAGERMGCTSANVAYHMRRIRHEYSRWSGDVR